MPNRITILPELVANKIAAGEVVERPASVVKELIENSLDADATDIVIDVQAGGKRLVRVQDDGVGMSWDDGLLAFERFGTSKVRTVADLDSITTLGFRGEALASIASVAQVALKTRERGADAGTLVVIHGGVLKKVEDVGCREGTLVEVANLFYNTPARRAFMVSTDTEFFWVTQTVTQYALCRPDVRFILTHNERKVIDAAVSDDFRRRIAAVLGQDLLEKLVSVSAKSDDMALKGHVGLPTKATSSGRRLQSIFVNRRAVSSKPLFGAIYDAYSPYLMRGRHPALVLFLEVDPKRVNVNVHPTKRQVRFIQQGRVCEFVRQAIVETLRRTLRAPVAEITRNLKAPSVRPAEPMAIDIAETYDEPVDRATPEAAAEFPHTELDLPEGEPQIRADAADAAFEPMPSTPARSDVVHPAVDARPGLSSAAKMPSEIGLEPSAEPPGERPIADARPGALFAERLVPVGQIDNSFVVAQGGGAVVILDQHAAHERIYYEKFLRQVRMGTIPSQRLLMPALLEMAPAMRALLLKSREILEPMGLELEDFGGGSIAVKSRPALLSDNDVEEIVAEIGELLAQSKKVKEASFRPVDEICALYACKAAVKADRPLSIAEMQELLDRLAKTDHPMTCPHGRPTTVELDLSDLRKSFLRPARK